jgi:hypothetical protein
MKKNQYLFTSKLALLPLIALSFLGNNFSATASEIKDSNQIAQLQDNSFLTEEPMEQVNSVDQLRDVSPGDWAYDALKNLVENYNCIAGYPNGTFRGNRSMTRYEFAAGLNACLESIQRLIASNQATVQNDLDTIKKLVEQFQAELTALGNRVDNLEGRTKFLEDHQFSTTTKLSGEAIFSISGATGGEPGGSDPEIVFNDRLRLNLTTSFSGKDVLITGLQAHNFSSTLGGGTSAGQILFPNDSSPIGDSTTALNFEPEFPGYNPQDLSTSCGNNSLCLYKLLYVLPVADKLTVFVAPKAEVTDAFPAIIPFASEGQGTISRFGALNPVLRVSGGTSGIGLAAAAGFIYSFSDSVDLRALYASVNASIPTNQGFPGTPLGSGLFNGSYVVATQLTLKPTDSLDIGLNYSHSYHQINITGIGSSGASSGVLAGLPLTTPVNMDSIGATISWRFSDKAYLTGYGSYIMVDEAGGQAFTNLTSWMAGLYFPDALAEGNSAGILFGQPLYRVDAGNGAQLSPANIAERSTPYHLEFFYNFKVSDNISITPGGFVLFNPEGDGSNDTTGVAVLRTTFSF